MTIRGLEQIDKSHLEIAGGKGANLGELLASGFPVPPGFVICADEYRAFMSGIRIPTNNALPEDAETEAWLENIRKEILDKPLEPTLIEDIDRQHQDLIATRGPDLVYAVRSSATAEDLADASFAGQHETYYYVTAENLPVMIRKCWASLWSDAAFSYRQSQGIEHRSVDMAVVVQEMIRSDVSGVTFTADPVSGSDSVIITESSWGMGAAIVDGRVSPDQYIVEKRNSRLTSIRISDKKFMVPAELKPGQVSRLLEVPANLRNAETLNDEQVLQIAELAIRSEQHFGTAQDIEWAIHDDELFFLQSRPVTVMGEETEEVPSGRYILFKPLAENFTDPLMPLTIDVLEDIVPMMTIIHGRAYMNFDHFKALLPVKRTDADIARLAYLSDPVEQNPRVSIPKLISLALLLFGNYLTMGVFSRRVTDMPDDFMSSYRAYSQKIVDDDSINPPDAFLHLFVKFRFFEPAGNMVILANLVAPRYMLMLPALRSLLKRWAPSLPEDASSVLCSGIEGVLSTEMGREIMALAVLARQDEFTRQTILDLDADTALAMLREQPEGTRFVDTLQAFLDKHGHRAPKEFELSSVRWEEDPAQVIGMVRNYLTVDTDPDTTESGTRTRREAMMQDLTEQLALLPLERPLRWREFILRGLLERTRYYMKLRENSRFYHIMGFYSVRRKFLKIEQQLLESGSLKCKDDIFYLKWEEVQQLQQGELGWPDVEETIRTRRMEHIRLTKLTPPRTIGLEFDDGDQVEASGSTTNGPTINGQGASPGRYEGIARVIMDPVADSEIRPGEILIAPFTDPAWTPLFLTAHAAVVEVGSYLSHAGTIAREYGMPCVVDAANCTSRIKTGDRLIVDGTQGSVTLLENSS